MSLRFRLPAAPLRPYVSAYHFVTIETAPDHLIEDLFYPGWPNVRFTLTGDAWSARIGTTLFDPVPASALFGVTSRAATVRAGSGRLVGAGLTPLGWARLFEADALRFVDRIASLAEVIGAEADALLQRLRAEDRDEAWAACLDTFFDARLKSSNDPPDLVLAVHQLLNDPEVGRVEDVAESLGMSTRQVTRVAQRLFGLSPKLLLRRQRFMRTLMELHQPSPLPWSERLDMSYHDHSHFVRDCHRFLGMSPSRFFALPRPILESSTRARSRLLGVGAQALHPPERSTTRPDDQGASGRAR